MAPRAVVLVLTFNCFLENSSEVIFIKVVQCIHSIVKIKDIAPQTPWLACTSVLAQKLITLLLNILTKVLILSYDIVEINEIRRRLTQQPDFRVSARHNIISNHPTNHYDFHTSFFFCIEQNRHRMAQVHLSRGCWRTVSN